MNEDRENRPADSEAPSSNLPAEVEEKVTDEEDEINRRSEMPFLDHLE